MKKLIIILALTLACTACEDKEVQDFLKDLTDNENNPPAKDLSADGMLTFVAGKSYQLDKTAPPYTTFKFSKRGDTCTVEIWRKNDKSDLTTSVRSTGYEKNTVILFDGKTKAGEIKYNNGKLYFNGTQLIRI